ncbi:hypothetical protein MAR_015999 [Mya arenaria]|uniref:Uncharacterized protein n=1 Tax=Mya arenaria TaxID=6604 RepID=A0ABY7FIK1_MYAAR|nr:hypothetical protein MAR_015999 [Mya arenaria]
MNVSMILRICLILRVIHEVSGGFIPVESRCAKTCSRQEMGWSFNCDGDNTTCDWQCAAQRKDCPEGLTYHCAADYEDFELHTGNINYLEECALEKPCKRDYTCISHCPDGYHRTDDSDKCVERASATQNEDAKDSFFYS